MICHFTSPGRCPSPTAHNTCQYPQRGLALWRRAGIFSRPPFHSLPMQTVFSPWRGSLLLSGERPSANHGLVGDGGPPEPASAVPVCAERIFEARAERTGLGSAGTTQEAQPTRQQQRHSINTWLGYLKVSEDDWRIRCFQIVVQPLGRARGFVTCALPFADQRRSFAWRSRTSSSRAHHAKLVNSRNDAHL